MPFLLPLALAFAQEAPAPEAPSPAAAPDALALSVEEALHRATGASEDVEVAEAAVDRARGTAMQARAGWLPSVNASADYAHTFASEYDDLFGDMGDTGGASPFADLPFGQDDTWRVGVSVSQPLWMGGRTLASTRLARSSATLADVGRDSARAGAALDVAQAYYDAVLADRLVAIAAAAEAQAQTTAEQAALAFEVGRQPEFEVVRARVELEGQRVAVIQQERVRTLAHLQLKRLLDLPTDTALTLTSELDERPAVAEAAADVAGVRSPDAERVAVRQAEEAVRMSEATLARTRSQRFPQVAASASYGWVAYPDGVLPPTDTEEWATNFVAGVGLSVPLFAGGRIAGELVGARADVAEARARADQVAELAAVDAADARAGLKAAQAQWGATAGTVEQAERAYAIAEVRFREGLSTQAELTDARLLLQRAQANRALAARNLQVARIRVALLPALPLGAGAGASSASTASTATSSGSY